MWKIVGGNCITTIHCICCLCFTCGENFLATSITFLIFFEHDCSLKPSIGIIMVCYGTSNIKKVVFFKRQFYFDKTDSSLFRKRSTKQACGDKDIFKKVGLVWLIFSNHI